MAVSWSYYDKFSWADDKYLPIRGQGETMATQIVTAVSKLVYKWYNDGDVYDNTYALKGWYNDLSSYANWLVQNTDRADVLFRIANISTESEYEDILKTLTDLTHEEKYLEEMNKRKAVESIYDCEGVFVFTDKEYIEDES